MTQSSTDIRSTAESLMRGAARALRCGPLPRDCVAAVPVPFGKPGIVCSTGPDAGAARSLGQVVLAMASADLTALQRDLLWGRAFDLSWKELQGRNPGYPRQTLQWHHGEALAEFSRALRKIRK